MHACISERQKATGDLKEHEAGETVQSMLLASVLETLDPCDLVTCVFAPVCACVNSISPGAEKGVGVIQLRRHNTRTISEAAHITQALVADRHQ